MSQREGLSITPEISVLTILRGRDGHLLNLVRALAGQILPPDELVIAYMQDEKVALPEDLPFDVVSLHLDEEPMPLAAARNAAAAEAQGEVLIFLDVDCIPSPSLVMAYALELKARDACLMGEVLYLPEGATDGADAAALDEAGERHPAKPSPPETGIVPEPDYGELWGLSFAMRRTTFKRSGGLDERFRGYGAEETDFARTLEARKVPLARCGGARAYHQHHGVFQPPLHRFDDIVRNARLFHDKWGDWPMDYWLGQLEQGGFIERRGGVLDVKRRPGPEEVAAAKAPMGTRFS